MENIFDNGVLKIELPERIDANNASAVEKELFGVPVSKTIKEILLDAENLNYISPLGLRIILKFKKSFKNTPLSIINASDTVYNVFDDTGFSSFITVRKEIRFIDINSLKLIGAGMYGSVYRINDEQILKVFNKIQSESEIKKIVEVIKTAFMHDIPTIIPFETVRTEKGFGIVLELLNATVLSSAMHNNSKDFDRYVVEMAELTKTLANTEFEEGLLKNRNDIMTEVVESVSEYFSAEEISKIKSYIDIVPRRNSAVHGDFHARNVMIMDDNLLLIDMDEFSCGHPVWDVGGVNRIYQVFAHLPADIIHKLFEIEETAFSDFYFKIIGMTIDEADHCWEKFFNEYFSDYSAQEKIYMAETAKVYGLFIMLVFSIERCHLVENNSARLQMKIDSVRYFLNEMQTVDNNYLIKAFEVWK